MPFLPASTKPSSLLFVDGVVYTTTTSGCGATQNGVWAIDLTAPVTDTDRNPERKVSSWQTGGADIAGSSGMALGTDGTIYVALGSAPAARPGEPGPASGANHANAVVALDRQTLKVKDWFIAGAPFVTSPVVIRHARQGPDRGGRERRQALSPRQRVARRQRSQDAARVELRPAPAERTVAARRRAVRARAVSTALAAWEDATAKWIAAPIGNHIVTFKIADAGGKPSLAQGWQSRDLVSPLAPIVVNGMVMAVSSGEYRGGDATLTAAARAKQSQPAVLYVPDGATGKEMWNSGKTITSFARAGLSAGGGQVYLTTYDHQVVRVRHPDGTLSPRCRPPEGTWNRAEDDASFNLPSVDRRPGGHRHHWRAPLRVVARGERAVAAAGGPGKDAVARMCGTCHPVERAASVRLTRAGWQDTIGKMMTLGAKGSDDDVKAVLEYLSTHFKGEAGKPLNLNTATSIDLESITLFLRKESAAWIAWRAKNGPCKTVDDLKKVPGVDFKKIEERRERLVCF